MIKKIVLWILVIACMGSIFFLSSQVATESDKVSEGFIFGIINFFDVYDVLSEAEVYRISDSLNDIVRVGAHFTIYALLGFLISLLLHQYSFAGIKMFVYSLVLSVLYACSDEVHQSFVPSRSAQLSDIVTDTCGAVCGILFSFLVLFVIKKICNKKSHGSV